MFVESYYLVVVVDLIPAAIKLFLFIFNYFLFIFEVFKLGLYLS